jgi:uncharacterized membrane protein YhaH (DUF805 family)
MRELLFSFRGRIGRAHWWFYGLGPMFLATLLLFFMMSVGLSSVASFVAHPLWLLAAVCGLSSTVRRLHDLGWPTWTVVVCGLVRGSSDPNKYGSVPI